MLGNTNSGIGSQVNFIRGGGGGICDRNWTSMHPQGGCLQFGHVRMGAGGSDFEQFCADVINVSP